MDKKILKNVGIFIVGGLVILAWWLGWFSVIFYILGLYGAVYVVSYIFKTTAVINFLLGIGGFILYSASFVIGLFLLYTVLRIMFTGNFFFGLILFFALGTFGALLYFIPMAIGIVLGYPLIFMSEDIEKRFYAKNNITEGLYSKVESQIETANYSDLNDSKTNQFEADDIDK